MPIGSLIGGMIGAGGASAAGAAAGAAGNQAFGNAQGQRTSNQSISSPYLNAGWASTNALLQALGLGHLTTMDQSVGNNTYGFSTLDNSNVGQDRTNALNGFQASPGYQWRTQQGVNALDRSAASRGMVQSGAQQKAVTDYGQNQASGEWGNYINQLMGLSGQGAGSASSVNNADTSAINSGNALLTTGLLGQAAGYSNSANALGSGISGAINSLGSLAGYTGFGRNVFAPPSPAKL